MKKKIICLTMILAVLVCIFTACDSKNKSENDVVSYSDLSFSDIYGKEYSDIFKDNKLTVVNLFATWCSPCVREIPELQKLSETLEEQNISVVGIVTDARYNGQIQEDIIETAKMIAENADASYPFLIPDESDFKGYINSMTVFPETLFIDSDGHIIDSVIGSNSFEEWTAQVERVVSSLEK